MVEIACGCAFNVALCDDGAVYSWGLGADTVCSVLTVTLCVGRSVESSLLLSE